MAAAQSDGVHDLSDAMNALSVNEARLKEFGLDDNVLAKLAEIECNFESIFSWDVKQRTGISENLMLEIIDKLRDKCELNVVVDNAFDLNRFYLQLIISYELYLNGSYEESLLEIESTVKFMETCKFDDSNEQYFDACYHIARATNAYIALTLNLDSDKILKDVKPIKSLNRAESAAVFAIKALVFMEYPPKGNDIGLKFADHARNLHSTEPEWIIIWLKAKGRVRRYYNQFELPDEHEINAAEIISTTRTKPRLLIQASKLFMELAFVHKLNRNFVKSKEFYKLSSDLTYKAIELAEDNLNQLYSCLMACIDLPKKFHSKTEIDNVIKKLSSVKNSRIDQCLGKYYLKYEKDYEKAKHHLSRAMAIGHFGSSLQLVKLECLLQPVHKFPLAKTLNLIYDVNPSPRRRLIILSQLLIYYYYCEDNPKELMHYLKLYMDQDIDNELKKRHLTFAIPLFQVNGFKPKQFFFTLSTKLKNIKNRHKWSFEERYIIEDTLNRFNSLTNKKYNQNKVSVKKQCNESNSNIRYPYKNNKTNWQKRLKSFSEIDASKNDGQLLNNSSGNITSKNNHSEMYDSFNKESRALLTKKTVNNFKKPLKTKKNKDESQLHKSMDNLNNSKNSFYEMKLKKFESQYTSLNNLHEPTDNYSTHRPITSLMCGKDKSNRRNQTDEFQFQEGNSSQNNYNQYKNSQRSHRGRYSKQGQHFDNRGSSNP